MGYKLIETLRPLVAPSLRSGRYSFRALWSLFNLYLYVSLSNYHLVYYTFDFTPWSQGPISGKKKPRHVANRILPKNYIINIIVPVKHNLVSSSDRDPCLPINGEVVIIATITVV